MVEEASAASTSLANETVTLRELIGQFKVDDATGHQTYAFRKTA
jgi:methyl-accepting chemotaxis protein